MIFLLGLPFSYLIGPVVIDPPVLQAPMAGFTNYAYRQIIRQFGAVKPNRLLFTKLDEAVTLGPIFSVVNKQHISVGYVTTGQTVPDNLLPDGRFMGS